MLGFVRYYNVPALHVKVVMVAVRGPLLLFFQPMYIAASHKSSNIFHIGKLSTAIIIVIPPCSIVSLDYVIVMIVTLFSEIIQLEKTSTSSNFLTLLAGINFFCFESYNYYRGGFLS